MRLPAVLLRLTAVWLVTLPAAVAAQTQVGAVAEFDAKIAALEELLRQDPDHPTAWRELLEARMFRRAVSGEAKGETREEGVEVQRRGYLEWIEAQPWNGGGYIGYGATLPLAERQEYLVEALARAPRSLELLQMTLFVLQTAGENDRATRVAEQFLIHNPGDPAGFEAVYNHMLRVRNGARAQEVLETWLVAAPDDGPALLVRYQEDVARSRSDGERSNLAEDLARRVAPGGRALKVCAALAADSFNELARDCYRRSLGNDLGPSQTAQAQAALAELDREPRDASHTADVARLPERERSRFLARAALDQARAGDCEMAVRTLETPAFDGSLAAHEFVALYDSCGHGGPHEDRLRAITARFSDAGLEYLLRVWPETQASDFIQAATLARLRSGSHEGNLWINLDRLYAASGREDKRRELFSIWQRSTNPKQRRVLDEKHWSDALWSMGAYGELESFLNELTRRGARGEGYTHIGRLADLYVARGRYAEAADTIERMQAIESRWPSLARHRQSDIHLARLSWAQGDLAETEAAYRRFLEADFNFSGTPFREYCYFMAANDRLSALYTALEELYEAASRAPELRVTGGLEEWVATRLEKVHLVAPALEYLELAVARQPDNGALHDAIYRLAVQAENTERARVALETLVELDPQNPEVHDRLAAFRMSVENSGSALDVLDSVPSDVEQSSPRLRARRASALIAEGRLVEGIRMLRQLDAERPGDPEIEKQLQRAYTLLGEQQASEGDGR